MNTKTFNKKIVVSVLIFAFILPFIFTGIYSEASETKASLQQNMKTYGFGADTKNMKIQTTKAITRYMTAGDANNRVNGLKAYPAGTYYIYRSVNGAINLTKQQNTPGSWINARDLAGKTVSYQQTNSKASIDKNATTVKLNSNVKVYVSADDAVRGVNSKATYAAGTYYVYKSTSQAFNITRVKGQPGAWVAKKSVSSKTEAPVSKPAPKGNATSPNIVNSKGKIVIKGKVNIYMTAADALNGTNARGAWSSGTYHIYKSYGKAINITTEAGQPGSWIDGSKLTSSSNNTSNNNSGNKVTSPAKKINEQVLVQSAVKVYATAYDAKLGKNPVATFSKGTYYIFNISGNSVNISSQKGQPGGWIVADVKTVPTSDIKTDSDTIISGKTFVLVLDPGHGAGSAHNRGGVLFNEGDKNYEFTQNIINEASKYSNVVVKSTRKNNSENPSYEERAKAGKDADLYVSIHSNAAQSHVRGVEAWGSQKNSDKGHKFAKDITKTWSEKMSTPDRGVMYDYKDANLNPQVSYSPDKSKDDTWFIYKGNTAKEKVLLESMFHTNLKDSQAFLNNQDLLAREFMKIVARNFGLRLK